jgi:hypothetical protein
MELLQGYITTHSLHPWKQPSQKLGALNLFHKWGHWGFVRLSDLTEINTDKLWSHNLIPHGSLKDLSLNVQYSVQRSCICYFRWQLSRPVIKCICASVYVRQSMCTVTYLYIDMIHFIKKRTFAWVLIPCPVLDTLISYVKLLLAVPQTSSNLSCMTR